MNMPWYSQWSALRASLASSHRVSIREGFEWTEVEPPVRCVLQRRRREVRRAGIQTGRDRQTGRKEQKERGTKTQGSRTASLFIDSHVCTDEFLSVPRLGPHAAFRPQHD